jgi:hypothetical protein
VKVKNPKAPAVKREAEEDWGHSKPKGEREMRPMKLSAKFLSAALLLIGCVSAASAQSYWYNGDYTLKQRGYYGTPYGGGPEYGSGGGDQYGYGPAYSYAKQAPDPLPPPRCDWRRVWNGNTGFAPASEQKVCRNLPAGRSPYWVKVKNPKAPAMKREAEEDWRR